MAEYHKTVKAVVECGSEDPEVNAHRFGSFCSCM